LTDARSLTADWAFPVPARFGPGRVREVPEICRRAGRRRPLVVTDRALAGLPVVRDLVGRLEGEGLAVAVFDAVKSNPTEANVLAARDAYRRGSHDLMIAMGGGSGLDAGKAAALLVATDRPLWDFEWGTGGSPPSVEAFAPLIAIPTTAGTGSEMDGSGAVITDEAGHAKRSVYHPDQRPLAVVLDPELTLSLPRDLTAWTGLDALTHAVEGYSVPLFHPLCDGAALQALLMIRDWLPRAVEDGGDIEARANMLAASSLAAVSFQKGLGGVHALAHAVGAVFDTHHGLTNAVLLPYVLQFNRSALGGKLDRLAQALGLQTAEALFDWVLRLRQAFGVPHALSALGVPHDALPALAETATRDGNGMTNPVPLDRESYLLLLERAHAGEVA